MDALELDALRDLRTSMAPRTHDLLLRALSGDTPEALARRFSMPLADVCRALQRGRKLIRAQVALRVQRETRSRPQERWAG
ncbi:MAG: hypothetical protein KF817_12635 [Phycisphaeraceae bacterium]|nr:hypothetical protein [Phycisphaeraceae bacterium]